MLTHEHVQHLARKNDTLAEKVAKLKAKGAKITGKAVRSLEVVAGATLGGVIQGLAKDQEAGAHILRVPADLGIGLGLNLAGFLDLAGDEWSHHLNNLGDGFLGAYFSDLGFHVGKRKRESGSFFKPKTQGALPSAAAHGEVSPQAMAEALLSQMQQRTAG